MLSQNKNRIAYLAAYALYLSYLEALLPRIAPFFRLGLANVIILLAFDLNIISFILLILIKTITVCMISGTLFSPFFIISLTQSYASGILMYGLNRIKGRWLSVYGISIAGSAISCITQIFLCSLYLRNGVFALAGPMLIFSIISGIVTATISQKLKIPQEIPEPESSENLKKEEKIKAILLIIFITVASISIFMLKNLYVLLGALIIAFTAQLLCKRKFKIIPHVSMWIFIILSTLFIPNGKILFKIWNFPITQGALIDGIKKSLKLSSVMALSQCMANLKLWGDSIFTKTIGYFNQIKFSNLRSNDFRLNDERLNDHRL